MFKNNNLHDCPDCGSDYVVLESIVENNAVLYFYKCCYCNRESSKTMILNAAESIWNSESLDDVIFDDKKEIEYDINKTRREIERLEEQILDYENDLLELEKELEPINEKIRKFNIDSKSLKLIY